MEAEAWTRIFVALGASEGSNEITFEEAANWCDQFVDAVKERFPLAFCTVDFPSPVQKVRQEINIPEGVLSFMTGDREILKRIEKMLEGRYPSKDDVEEKTGWVEWNKMPDTLSTEEANELFDDSIYLVVLLKKRTDHGYHIATYNYTCHREGEEEKQATFSCMGFTLYASDISYYSKISAPSPL